MTTVEPTAELSRIESDTAAVRAKFDALKARAGKIPLNRADIELDEITAALDAQTDALLGWALRRRAKDGERQQYSVDEVADLLDMSRESVRVLFDRRTRRVCHQHSRQRRRSGDERASQHC